MRGAFILAAAFFLGAASLFVVVLEENRVWGVDSYVLGRKAVGGARPWLPSSEAVLKHGVPSPPEPETTLLQGLEAALPRGSFSLPETEVLHGHGVPSSAPPEAGSPALLHRFDSSKAKVTADEGGMLGLGVVGDGKIASPMVKRRRKVFQTSNGDASPPPPPPNPWEERKTKKILTSIGCMLTILGYCNPIIVYWSTRSSMAMTAAFCNMIDFIASAMGTGAWLMFAVVQLHGEDGKTVGVEAVISNAMGLALLTIFMTIKVATPRNLNATVCVGSLIAFATISGLSVSFALFGPIQRDSIAAHDIALIATVLQIISQMLPYISAYGLFHPPVNPPAPVHIRNIRPLLVYSRGSSFVISLFWAMYAMLTYQHTMFEVANVFSTILGFGSLCIHLLYALNPAM